MQAEITESESEIQAQEGLKNEDPVTQEKTMAAVESRMNVEWCLATTEYHARVYGAKRVVCERTLN
jgi:hypothetical protein